MIRRALLLSCMLLMSFGYSQDQSEYQTFEAGEWLRYRLHYGFFNASYATLSIKDTIFRGEPAFHAVGEGRTTGLASLFFKVEDVYESIFSKSEIRPIFFLRDIDEGGYTKNLEVQFDSQSNNAIVNNIKNGTVKTFSTKENIQDLISSLYYLRKNFSPNNIEVGDYFTINMFYDSKNRELSLRYLGKEVMNTKYGKIECLKLMPATNRSRIFKGEGSITIWLTNDKNRLPIRVQADLLVGSIKADLEKFSGIANPIEIQINN